MGGTALIAATKCDIACVLCVWRGEGEGVV